MSRHGWWMVSFPRIDLAKEFARAPVDARELAESMAKDAPAPVIPGLPYTESRWEWALLRRHAANGQIDPAFIRRLRTVDLEYLAGWGELNPTQLANAETKAQEVKVVENAVRASRELQRRATMSAAMSMTFIAAFVGVVVGAVIASLMT